MPVANTARMPHEFEYNTQAVLPTLQKKKNPNATSKISQDPQL
jgi:hypothetical protein